MKSEELPDGTPAAVITPQLAPGDAARRPNLRFLSFGDPTAEGDVTFLFDRQCFFETDIYQRCTELRAPLFVVGRRGSGKSATRMALTRHFAQDHTNLTVVISPQSFHFAHAKALARAMMKDTDVNWEFLFTSLWATTLRGAWAAALVGYYKVRNTDQDDLKALTDFVNAVVEPGTVCVCRAATVAYASKSRGPVRSVVGARLSGSAP